MNFVEPSDAPRPQIRQSICGATDVPTDSRVNELVQPRWSHLDYRWRLENFWELRALACVEALEDENGGLIWSQRFGDKDRGYWQLKLYPYGDLSPAGRGHVSLFLSLDLKSLEIPKAYAIFGCYLMDDEGNKLPNSGRSFTRQKFAEGSSSWGWSQFIKIEGQTLNRLLIPPNDALIIKCEIEVFLGVMACPGRALKDPRDWAEDLRRYLNSPSRHDIAIVCGDRITQANRTVLSARSRWFEKSLSTIAADTSTGVKTHVKEDCENMQDSEALTTGDTSSTHWRASTGAAPSLAYTSFSGPPPAAPLSVPDHTKDDTPANRSSISPKIMAAPVGHDLPTFEVDIVQPDVLENCVAFMQTDDCPYLNENTPLPKLLEFLEASRMLQIDALTQTLIRKLKGLLISRANAIAIHHVAQELSLTELADYCTSYLLLAVRELGKEDILRILAPKARVL